MRDAPVVMTKTRPRRCPRNHPIVEPNVRCQNRCGKERLKCLACSRARAYRRLHPELDLQELSDRYYDRIVNAAGAAR